jgi:hypothetical protein
MATYHISAHRADGMARNFAMEGTSRQDAEAQVRGLGWEPDAAAMAPARVSAAVNTAPGRSGGILDGLDRERLMVWAGAIGLVVGTWTPVITISAMGQTHRANVWVMGNFWPYLCIGSGVMAGLFALMQTWKMVLWTACAAGLLLFIRMIMLWTELSDLGSAMGRSGADGDAAMAQVFLSAMGIQASMGFGWVLLLGSAVVLFIGSAKIFQREGG